MAKTSIIALREFRQQVRKRGFLLVTIGLPVVFLVIGLATGAINDAPAPEPAFEATPVDRPDQVIGYVDQAGLIQTIPDSIPGDLFQAFPNVRAAEAALENSDIGAYYIIPPDYRETGNIRRVSPRLTVQASDGGWFDRLLIANLLPEADPAFLARLRRPFYSSGLEFGLVSPEGRTKRPGNPMIPFLATMAILLPLFTSGGYLFQSLAQEKSSRVMEILLVSLRPHQLLTGKILGLGALTGVQYAIWMGLGLLAWLVAGRGESRLLAGLNLTLNEAGLVVAFALSGFLLYAAVMAGVGALTRDVEDSRAWLFVISLPMMLPLYLGLTITGAPDDPLAVALSLFPFSAPAAMLMRMTSAAVPGWQIAVSLILLVLTGLGLLRLMARLFRVQTLLSGESISIRRFLAALRP